jgi:hypothetical protein
MYDYKILQPLQNFADNSQKPINIEGLEVHVPFGTPVVYQKVIIVLRNRKMCSLV